MLILEREINESVIITTPEGHKIRVVVYNVNHVTKSRDGSYDAHVKLGFEAGQEITIHREEVQRVIDKKMGKAWDGTHRPAA